MFETCVLVNTPSTSMKNNDIPSASAVVEPRNPPINDHHDEITVQGNLSQSQHTT